ncbi:hypothetical protein SAMN05421503_3238 [Terribacillus aidingensis]|uniref:Uncharacterized protein n=1 Tax=Terribacillus aidingensis TaxID=586416 RepID=A0A285P6T2_9BACI|nr:hypothetical protein SAMN05421503_3238 [Terribacillus aidingensis]
MILNIICFFIIVIILIVLLKLKMINLVKKDNYIFTRSRYKLKFSYKLFNGVEYHYFKFRKNQILTFTYDVKVDSGELILEWRDRKKLIWRKNFCESAQGNATFHTDRRFYSIVIEGNNTKGGCQLHFTE